MTPQEANFLRWMEHRGGTVTDTAMRTQFGVGGGGLEILLGSLMRHQYVERDRRHYRVTTVGEDALGVYEDPPHRAPFEGRPRW